MQLDMLDSEFDDESLPDLNLPDWGSGLSNAGWQLVVQY